MSEFQPQRPPPSPPIATEKLSIERKTFFLDLKENQRGRFLKITEDVGGRRDTIMLPAEAFKDFLEAFERLVEFEGKLSRSDDAAG
jgi:PurA ssDNA and RNA-binding protein